MNFYETTIPIEPLLSLIKLFVDDFNNEVCVTYLLDGTILIATDNLLLIDALKTSKDIKPIELTVTEQMDLLIFGKGVECYWGNIYLFIV